MKFTNKLLLMSLLVLFKRCFWKAYSVSQSNETSKPNNQDSFSGRPYRYVYILEASSNLAGYSCTIFTLVELDSGLTKILLRMHTIIQMVP